MKYMLLVCFDESVELSQEEGADLLPATRADLLRRLGRAAEAAASYRQALELAATDAERRYLSERLNASVRDAQPS